MYFFIADEHFSHANIIKYCKRPFDSVEEMDATIIKNFNSKVTKSDCTIHCGDFTFKKPEKYIKQLNGNHIFLRGNHDRWMGKSYHEMWIKTIEGQTIVCAHYAMRVWPRSHYGSWNLFGHSHGKLPPIGLQYDVGVDNNNFFPVSFEELKSIFIQRKSK
ncbi:MAG: phosphoesterase [Nitrospiraceae bacterium]|nr:phosphoesterase [Nitrospiraceae bacterium]